MYHVSIQEVHNRGHGYSNRSYQPCRGVLFTHALTTYRRLHDMYSATFKGSPARVSAMAYLNNRVSSPSLSPIQVPSTGSPAEVSTYGPERCVQGSATPNERPAYPATCLPPHSPPLGSALPTASSILQTPETTCNSWTEDKGG